MRLKKASVQFDQQTDQLLSAIVAEKPLGLTTSKSGVVNYCLAHGVTPQAFYREITGKDYVPQTTGSPQA